MCIYFFHSLKGVITEWEYFASREGTVFLSVWRFSGGENFSLVGTNEVDVPQIGAGVRTVATSL